MKAAGRQHQRRQRRGGGLALRSGDCDDSSFEPPGGQLQFANDGHTDLSGVRNRRLFIRHAGTEHNEVCARELVGPMRSEIHDDTTGTQGLGSVKRRRGIRQRHPRSARLQQVDGRQSAPRGTNHRDLATVHIKGLHHHRTFNVARLRRAKMIARIRNRVITSARPSP